MTSSLADAPSARMTVTLDYHDAPLQGQVWNLLTALYPQADRMERRNSQRFPYARLVHLTPVSADGETVVGETVVAAGKHLSERGLGFYHPGPLAHRLVVAALEKAPGEWLHLLMDVSWCRFRRQGWYESGGRFLRVVPCPRSSTSQ